MSLKESVPKGKTQNQDAFNLLEFGLTYVGKIQQPRAMFFTLVDLTGNPESDFKFEEMEVRREDVKSDNSNKTKRRQ